MTKSKVDTKAKHHEEKKGKPQNQRFTDYLCVSNCTLQTFSFLTCSSKDARRGPSKVIDVTVPVQCQDMDLQLFLTESSKVLDPVSSAGKFMLKVTALLLIRRESFER